MNKHKRKVIRLQAKAVRKMVSIVPDSRKMEPKSFYRQLYKARGENYRPRHAYQIASQQPDSVLASVFRELKDNRHIQEGIPLWHWCATFGNKSYFTRRFVGDFYSGVFIESKTSLHLKVGTTETPFCKSVL